MILLAGKEFGTYSRAELAHFHCIAVSSGVDALAHLISGLYDQMVLGDELSPLCAVDVLELWRSIDHTVPTILLQNAANWKALRRSVQLGISDFLIGNVDLAALHRTATSLSPSVQATSLDADLLEPTPKLLTLFRASIPHLSQQCTAEQCLAAGQTLQSAICQRMVQAYPWLSYYVPQTAPAGSVSELERQLCDQLDILHRIFPKGISLSFRKILTYVLTHMDLEPHQPEIAAAFYLSSSALSQLFTRELGCGFRSYVAECRMLRAASLLCTMHPQQAAEQLGYQDYSYFTKQFRKRFGLFPTEYQSTMGKERKLCTQPTG